jgi:hypothetical protein
MLVRWWDLTGKDLGVGRVEDEDERGAYVVFDNGACWLPWTQLQTIEGGE